MLVACPISDALITQSRRRATPSVEMLPWDYAVIIIITTYFKVPGHKLIVRNIVRNMQWIMHWGELRIM